MYLSDGTGIISMCLLHNLSTGIKANYTIILQNPFMNIILIEILNSLTLHTISLANIYYCHPNIDLFFTKMKVN